jgi:hypothetical protein
MAEILEPKGTREEKELEARLPSEFAHPDKAGKASTLRVCSQHSSA